MTLAPPLTRILTFFPYFRANFALMATVIVKLGGAAITDKSISGTLSPNIDNLVDGVTRAYHEEFRPLGRHLIIIHGAGSFGHPPAKKYRVKSGWLTLRTEEGKNASHSSNDHARRQLEQQDEVKFGMALTRQRVLRLHHHILQRLQDRGGLPVLSVSPYDTVETNEGTLTEESSDRLVARVQYLLSQGFVPLLFGDAVLDRAWGATILSGDALMHKLATRLPSVRRCVFITDVAGIYTRDPKHCADAVLIQRLHCHEQNDSRFHEQSTLNGVDDVTGAMKSKWQWAKNIMSDAHHVSNVIICEAATSNKAMAEAVDDITNDDDVDLACNAWTIILR